MEGANEVIHARLDGCWGEMGKTITDKVLLANSDSRILPSSIIHLGSSFHCIMKKIIFKRSSNKSTNLL